VIISMIKQQYYSRKNIFRIGGATITKKKNINITDKQRWLRHVLRWEETEAVRLVK
jgi:hypothetical protein